MNDDKRQMRQLMRDIKRVGNKKRRRYLKNLAVDPQEFDFGRDRTDVMNEPQRTRKTKPPRHDTPTR